MAHNEGRREEKGPNRKMSVEVKEFKPRNWNGHDNRGYKSDGRVDGRADGNGSSCHGNRIYYHYPSNDGNRNGKNNNNNVKNGPFHYTKKVYQNSDEQRQNNEIHKGNRPRANDSNGKREGVKDSKDVDKSKEKDHGDATRGLFNFITLSGFPDEITEEKVRGFFTTDCQYQIQRIKRSKKRDLWIFLFKNEEDVFSFLYNFKEEILITIKDRINPYQVEIIKKIGDHRIKMFFSEARLSPMVEISKEFMNALPIGKFGGKIIVVDSNLNGQVDEAINQLIDGRELNQIKLGEIILGMDIEWKPNFEKGEKPSLASLLQIATEKEVYLFRLTALVVEQLGWTTSFQNYPSWSSKAICNRANPPFALPKSLVSLLSSKNVFKVGVGLSADALKMKGDYGVEMGGVLDISDLPILNRYSKKGLKPLTSYFFGVRQIESSQRTNWEMKHLEDRHLNYAANDAHYSLLVWNKLRNIEYKTVLTRLSDISVKQATHS